MRGLKYYILIGCILLFSVASASRIKDITNIAGVRDNQLIGYGLVVGLSGTGDKVNQAPFTQQSFMNMLLEFGIRLPNNVNLELKNVAAVAINATLPPFARVGQRIDVTVSSIGNSSSLRGGVLLLSPLKGADGKTYGMAQGSVVVSGFGASGSDGSKVTVNVPSGGSIPSGATVEDTIEMPFVQEGRITFELVKPDFTNAVRIEQAINHEFGRHIARAIDAGSVAIMVDDYNAGPFKGEGAANPENMMSRYVPLISRVENIRFDPANSRAKVIVNSRTGTIVAGEDVSISAVAVAHGNLSVVVSERPFVSQPGAFASSGKTVQGKASEININATQNRAFLFSPGASLGDLVDAINRVGAAPGDIMAILEAINAAGALHADLEVI